PLEQRHRKNALGKLPVMLLKLAPDKEVELLIGAAELDIRLHRDGIVALHERIQELMNRYGLTGGIAFCEVVALEHPCNGPRAGQADQPCRAELIGPFGIEQDLSTIGVEDLEDLVLIRFRVLQYLLSRKRRARLVLSARVADHSREIADQELDLVPE